MNERDILRGELLSEGGEKFVEIANDGKNIYLVKRIGLGEVIDLEVLHEGNTGSKYQIALVMECLYLTPANNPNLTEPIKVYDSGDKDTIIKLPIDSKGASIVRLALNAIHKLLSSTGAEPTAEEAVIKKSE